MRRSFRIEDITIDRIVDNQIRERWVVGDMPNMSPQLGVIPAPQAKIMGALSLLN